MKGCYVYYIHDYIRNYILFLSLCVAVVRFKSTPSAKFAGFARSPCHRMGHDFTARLHQQADEITALLTDARSYVASDDDLGDLGHTEDDHRSNESPRHEQPVEARRHVPTRLARLSTDCPPRRRPTPRPKRRLSRLSRKASLRRCKPCSRGEAARAWSSATTAASAAVAATAAVPAGAAVPAAAPRLNGVARTAVAAHRPGPP